MSMPLPQKIVLKNSTSMCLNDRFTRISAVRPPSRQTFPMNTLTTLKNQRLAQQLANRNMMPLINGLPVVNRIGVSNVKARLGYRRGSVGNIMAVGRPYQRRRGFNYSVPYTQRPRRGVTGIRGVQNTQQNLFRNYNRGMFKARGQYSGSGRIFYNNSRNSYPATRGRGRGRGGMRGGRGGRTTSNPNPPKESKTSEQLDTELEQYMSTS